MLTLNQESLFGTKLLFSHGCLSNTVPSLVIGVACVVSYKSFLLVTVKSIYSVNGNKVI